MIVMRNLKALRAELTQKMRAKTYKTFPFLSRSQAQKRSEILFSHRASDKATDLSMTQSLKKIRRANRDKIYSDITKKEQAAIDVVDTDAKMGLPCPDIQASPKIVDESVAIAEEASAKATEETSKKNANEVEVCTKKTNESQIAPAVPATAITHAFNVVNTASKSYAEQANKMKLNYTKFTDHKGWTKCFVPEDLNSSSIKQITCIHDGWSLIIYVDKKESDPRHQVSYYDYIQNVTIEGVRHYQFRCLAAGKTISMEALNSCFEEINKTVGFDIDIAVMEALIPYLPIVENCIYQDKVDNLSRLYGFK